MKTWMLILTFLAVWAGHVLAQQWPNNQAQQNLYQLQQQQILQQQQQILRQQWDQEALGWQNFYNQESTNQRLRDMQMEQMYRDVFKGSRWE